MKFPFVSASNPKSYPTLTNNGTKLLWLGSISAASLLGLLAAELGPLVLLAVIGLLFLGISLWRPWVAAYALLIVAFLAMPSVVPPQVSLFGVSMYLFEPFLVVAVIVALLRLRPTRFTDTASSLLLFILLGGSLVSIVAKINVSHVVSDVRSLFYFTGALFVAGRYAATGYIRSISALAYFILWISALLMLFSSVTGIPVAGRQEEATLYLEGAGSGGGAATRIITSTTNLALPVLAAFLACWIVGKTSKGSAIRVLLPSLIISFLGFSRNTLLGVAVAILFALVVVPWRDSWPSIVRRLLAVATSAFLVYMALPVLQFLPGSNFVADQLSTYASRVLDGLSQETLAVDTSVLYREHENSFLIQAIAEQPLLGHGFGYAYKPGEGEVGSFWADKGTIYAHNFYLWVWVKTGLIGLVGWIVLSALPITKVFRERNTNMLFLACGTVALLAVSVVAPMPIGSAGSVAIGLFMGASIAYKHVSQQRSDSLE